MNDPERLLEADGSALVRSMISAAREERPNDRALQRALLAATASGAVLGASAAAGGALGSSALPAAGTTSTVAVLKWLGIGVTAGLVTAGAAIQIEQRLTPPSVPAVATAPTAVVEAPVAPADELSPAVAPPPPPERKATKRAAPAPAATVELTEDDPSLNAEVAQLDRARKALAGGNSAGALAELGNYDRDFPSGRLGPEALFLRMEASLGKGDRASAERAARELVSKHPKSPHAARARAVLSGASHNP